MGGESSMAIKSSVLVKNQAGEVSLLVPLTADPSVAFVCCAAALTHHIHPALAPCVAEHSCLVCCV